MAVIMTPPPVPPDGGPPDAPATLTKTFYEQLAAHFSLILDEMAGIVPRDAALDHSASFVKTHLNIPLKFLRTTVASVEQVAELESTRKLDAGRARDTLQMIDAFRPICDKMAVVLRDLSHALDARHANLAVESLEAYHVAQSLARDESNPILTAWVANMSRDFGRRGPKSKKRAPAPDPVPAPSPAPDPVPVSRTLAPEKPNGWNG